ncbi:hypothetical protein GUJ93_ZPchr0013g37471 [Zizania palustris]|uniref:Cytochrome P450 n=1 Tax=Zizania palustris TaxID=103762 RepID=A0A8J6BX61_ZIZPA|nr:hypothetical protein GUJ93_ZPchr0013g37471 [Zizania palustris]
MVVATAASLCWVAACSLGVYLYYVLWLLPERVRADLRRQGIAGPRPSFPYGNLADMRRTAAAATKTAPSSPPAAVAGEQRDGGVIVHDYRHAVFPFYDKWRKEHGPVFMYSVGNMVFLHVSRPDLVRELSLCVSLDLGKSSYMKATHQPLFGEGIIKSSGHAWAHQRKLIAPEFFLDKVKGMVDLMVESAQVLVKSWEDRLDGNGGASAVNIKIDDDIRAYSADVISRACFGSSYVKGKQIFAMIRELQKMVSKKPNLLAEMTGLSIFPTASSRAAWRLNRQVRGLILDLVGDSEGDDGNLLSAMLRSASASGGGDLAAAAEDFVVDNCKNIYFAGYESTAVTASWCMMLLALHPEWQDRVRDEAQEACACGRTPDFPALQKMKNLTMVIQETLRLYPAGAVVSRQALRELSLGGVRVPKGVNIYVPVSTVHLDTALWGADAHEFDPGRFADARPPLHAYLPFGAGARTCLGQTFAIAELKVLLALVLCRFEVALSPEYEHSPVLRLIVEPEHGVRLMLKNVRPTR